MTLNEMENKFKPFRDKFSTTNIPEPAINSFKNAYFKLLNGQKGYISSSEAGPVDRIPHINELEKYKTSQIKKAAIIKLNGGLGTSMGLQGPKSMLVAKDGLTFLDILVNQVISYNKSHNSYVPLIFMNSFSTERPTLNALLDHPELKQSLPTTFIENKVPKVLKEDLSPANWPENPTLEWAPPGHGDIYAALLESGMLDKLLDLEYEYAFISNSDNLGATIDSRIYGYMEQEDIPFLMEVTRRTVNDKKGGHLAQNPNGQLMLREVAQCPESELEDFQNIEKYKYFNTNNIWINLRKTKELLEQNSGNFELPMIVNEKNVDPTNNSSPKVYQLETAMGAAIKIYKGAKAIEVDRDRFIPIKKTTDLLILWSDIYRLNSDYLLESRMELPSITEVKLDDNYYKFINDMSERFPYGAPSLKQCAKFEVIGDFMFGRDVKAIGKIKLENTSNQQSFIKDNTLLS